MNSAEKITKEDLKQAAGRADELPVFGVLRTLREGEFIAELDDAIQEAINTATELGKAAKLTIVLDIAPTGRTVVIDDDIKSKLPVAAKDSTIYFLDKGNRLTRTDPKQAQFPVEAGFSGRAGPAGNA